MTSDGAIARCDDPVLLIVLAHGQGCAYSVPGSIVSG